MTTVINYNGTFSSIKESPKTNYSRTVLFKRGETIPQTSNSIWLLKKGLVKTLTWSEAGNTIILGYWGEGDVIGSSLSTVNPYEARCLNPVEATIIPLQYSSYLFKEIITCVQHTDELLRIIRIEKMYDRLSQLLNWLASRFGSQVLEGVLINLRLTHQELADLIGSTRVTVTRLLNQLEKENAIARPRRFAIIMKDFE